MNLIRLSFGLVLSLLFTTVQASDPNSCLPIELQQSPQQVSPGQLVTLTLTTVCKNDTTVSLKPHQQAWESLHLSRYQAMEPQWQHGSWQHQLQLTVMATTIGTVVLPALQVDFQQAQQRWQQSTPKLTIDVIDRFEQQPPQLQSLANFDWPQATDNSRLALGLLLLLLLAFFGILWGKRRQAKTPQQQAAAKFKLPELGGSNNSALCKQLRLWVKQQHGFDPLAAKLALQPLAQQQFAASFQALYFKPEQSDEELAQLLELAQQLPEPPFSSAASGAPNEL